MNDRSTQLADLCQTHGIITLYVSGSRAREVYDWLHDPALLLDRGPSDIDIGVYLGAASWTVHEKVLVSIALENFFDVSRVDLVVLDEADLFVAAEIIRGNRLFAQDDHSADEYDLYVLRRAGDLIPLERERLALLFEVQP